MKGEDKEAPASPEVVKKLRKRVAELETQLSKYQQMEQSVRESEFRFHELFRNMSSCVAVYKAVDDGMDFEFLDFNQAAEKAEKIRKDELIGRRVTSVFPGVGDFGILEVFKRVWKSGNPEHHPISQYKDGRIAGWRENYIYKLPSGEIVALYNDVTERKQAEETLKISEEKFRNIFESANVGKSITLLTGEINVNQAFCDMLGYSREELKNMKWQELTPADEIESINEKLKPLLGRDKNSLRFEKRYIHKNGSYIWTDVSVSMRYDQERNPIHFITTIIDITEQKKAENELRKLKEELEIKVVEKTNELQVRITELERFRDATVEREFRMKELRDEIDQLKRGKS